MARVRANESFVPGMHRWLKVKANCSRCEWCGVLRQYSGGPVYTLKSGEETRECPKCTH